jgi:hypothetical protein
MLEMTTISSRERLRRAYRHEEMDRPGVYSRTGYPADDPSYDRLKAYLATHAELKVDWSGRAFETPYETHVEVEPYSEDFERHITTLRTPKGDLRQSRLVSLKGQPGLDETHLINDREDAEKYLSLPLPEIGGDVSSFFEADARVGERGIVNVYLDQNAGWIAHLCGSTNFALMSVTDRDILHALCERQMNVILATCKFLLSKGVGPYFAMAGQEQIVPPLHGPADFRDFNVRYDQPIIDLIHDAGGYIHVHCHARVKQVLPDFVAMGVDVLHPFEAPPMGDVTPAEAKAMAHGRMCLEGNIQIHRMYEASPEEIATETAALIGAVFDDRVGLIVSPTASPYIPSMGEICFPQYKAMVDTVLGWGTTS